MTSESAPHRDAMHVFFFVEEPSAEAALQLLIPKIVGPEHTFEVFTFNGKQALLKKLPSRLAGYRWVKDRPGYRIVVLVDRDRDDCLQLKQRLEHMVSRAGLRSKTKPGPEGTFEVINRIVVEELESWFIGDLHALRVVYPRLSSTMDTKPKFQRPDELTDTWRVLERELQRRNYFPSGLAKIELARAVAEHMEPDRNRSPSFRCFRDGLAALMSQ